MVLGVGLGDPADRGASIDRRGTRSVLVASRWTSGSTCCSPSSRCPIRGRRGLACSRSGMPAGRFRSGSAGARRPVSWLAGRRARRGSCPKAERHRAVERLHQRRGRRAGEGGRRPPRGPGGPGRVRHRDRRPAPARLGRGGAIGGRCSRPRWRDLVGRVRPPGTARRDVRGGAAGAGAGSRPASADLRSWVRVDIHGRVVVTRAFEPLLSAARSAWQAVPGIPSGNQRDQGRRPMQSTTTTVTASDGIALHTHRWLPDGSRQGGRADRARAGRALRPLRPARRGADRRGVRRVRPRPPRSRRHRQRRRPWLLR